MSDPSADLATAIHQATEHGHTIPCLGDPHWTTDPPRGDRARDNWLTHMRYLARQCLTACPVLDACQAWADAQTEPLTGVIAGHIHQTDPRCGTYAGYLAHRAAHALPCAACRDAKRRYSIEQRASP